MTVNTESPARRGVTVVPHILEGNEEWPDSVAVMHPNGALMIWHLSQYGRPGTLPTKIYAAGSWRDVTHYGDFMAPPMPSSRPAHEVGADQQRATAEFVEEMASRDPQELERDRRRAYTDPIEELSPERLDDTNGDVRGQQSMGVIPRPQRPIIKSEPGARHGVEPPPFDEQDDTDDRASVFSRAVGGVAKAAGRVRSRARDGVGQFSASLPPSTSYGPSVRALARPTSPESWWVWAVLLSVLPVVWMILS